MKTALRNGWWSLVVALVVGGVFVIGCSPPADKGPKTNKPAGEKKADVTEPAKTTKPDETSKPPAAVNTLETPKKPDETAAPPKPVEPAGPALTPESPTKNTPPKSETPKPVEPSVKPAEPPKPAEPAVKPEPPKPVEPAVKPEEPKPAEPAMKPEEPPKPAEPAVKPEPPKPAEPAAKPEEKKPTEPAAKPEPAKPAEPAPKPEDKKPAAAPAAGASIDPAATKVSAFAPAEDLENQMAAYLKDLGKAVENEQEYKDAEGKLPKDANTVVVIALALGLHDQDNKYKANAAAIIKAAQALAEVKDFAAAQKGVEALKATAEATAAGGAALKWEKMASLPELMKAVPLINTKLKRNTQEKRFKSKAKDTAGYSAVIAAIGQASLADTSATKSPDQVPQWQKFCVQMRDAAGALNAAIRKGDAEAATPILDKLAQSCDDCHTVFHPAALGKTEKAE